MRYLIVLSVLILAAGTARAQVAAEVRPCLECHSLDGLRKHPEAPILHGQDRRYLMQQLTSFQRDVCVSCQGFVRLERKHPVMSDQAHALEKSALPVIAEYFANRECMSARAVDLAADLPKPPNDLIAECFFCHGYEGHNKLAFVPNLAGQRAAYLRNQLREFRDTKQADLYKLERGRSHPMMTRRGARLDDAEIDALATYFAGRTCR